MRILQIDDHALFRDGLAQLLGQHLPDLEIVGAGTLVEGLALLQEAGPFELVLLDLALPDATGPMLISTLRAQAEAPPVVCVSSDSSRDTVLACIAAGAMAYVPKSASSEAMLAALRVVLTGGIYLPASVRGASVDMPALGDSPATPALSPRQKEVLRLLLEGRSNKDICRELGLSPATIKTHVSAVLRVLNVTTRTQAVLAASRLGLRF